MTSVFLRSCFRLGAALVSDVFQNYLAVAKSCSWWVTKVEKEGIKKKKHVLMGTCFYLFIYFFMDALR